MTLQTRLEALESRLAGRILPAFGPGPLAWPDGSEHGRVYACLAPKQPKLSGWPDFASKTVWLDRESCPYADACKFADTCAADGRHPGLATQKDAELS